jgi:hypothetical protein
MTRIGYLGRNPSASGVDRDAGCALVHPRLENPWHPDCYVPGMQAPATIREAPVRVVITYHAAPGRRAEVAGLLAALGEALEPLLLTRGRRSVSEDPARPGRFIETLVFPNETTRASFDVFQMRSRTAEAINASLEDLLEAERCDFQVFRAER